MMSSAISLEIRLFFNAFLLGVILIFSYDFLRIFRKILKHTKTHEAIEDTVYWIIAGFIVFVMLYHNNNGIIRWFAISGVTLGMFLYNISISKFIVKYVSIFFIKIINIVSKILFKPIIVVLKHAYFYTKSKIKVLNNSYKSIRIKQIDKIQKYGVHNEKDKKKKKEKHK